VEVDVARIGRTTPWLKTAHLAEKFNVPVCPHFLKELHVALCCAAPNARWLENIPQLDDITSERMAIYEGYAAPSAAPGLAIAWDFKAIGRLTVEGSLRSINRTANKSASGRVKRGEIAMQRMGLCNRLRPEKAAEYKALHAAGRPGVLATIAACNIGNFSIFLRTPENLLFAYWKSQSSVRLVFAGLRYGAPLHMTPRFLNDTTVPGARLRALSRRRPVPVNT